MISAQPKLWHTYYAHKLANKKRINGFDEIRKNIKQCHHINQLLQWTKKAHDCDQSYPYSHLPRKVNYSIFLFVYAVICYFFVSYIYIFLIGVAIIAACIFYFTQTVDHYRIKSLSKAIYRKKVEIVYGLSSSETQNKKEKFRCWRTRYALFKEGDENISLNSVKQIKLLNNTKADFFDFEYETESTSGTGNDVSITNEHHQHYGFVFPFESDDIQIFSPSLPRDAEENWKTESKAFNYIYNVSAKNQNVAAKFLSPIVINLFLNLAKVVNNCNFEVSNNIACLSLEDEDFFVKGMQNSLSTFDEFYQEIKQTQKSIAIEAALELINELCVRKSTGEGIEQ